MHILQSTIDSPINMKLWHRHRLHTQGIEFCGLDAFLLANRACINLVLVLVLVLKFYRNRQGRINHCAGCTMGGAGPRRQGPPINCQIFTTLFWRLNVWTFSVCRLKRNDDDLKGRQLFGGRKVHPRENPGYAYEKRTTTLRWDGAPEWLTRPWESSNKSRSIVFGFLGLK